MKPAGRPRTAPNRESLPSLATEIEQHLSVMRCSTAAELRAMRREFSRRLRAAEASTVFGVAERLLKTRGTVHRFVAYELIHHHPAALASLDAKRLECLGQGIDSWGAVDCFGVSLSGPAWRERFVKDSLIRGWARSEDHWWRRAALVSTVPLNSESRGGAGDVGRTLGICRLLQRDRDPMVMKALSWALRELAKRDPAAVRKYVSDRKDVLPALVLREVKNKLDTGVKNPKRH
jgi:3-methyladenine DNA glycosylase AlkD